MSKFLNVLMICFIATMVILFFWQEKAFKREEAKYEAKINSQIEFVKKLAGHKITEVKKLENGNYCLIFDNGNNLSIAYPARGRAGDNSTTIYLEVKEK